MNEVDKAYLAGIVDGEGCITIRKQGPYYVPSISISNTNEVLINHIKTLLDYESIKYCMRYEDRGDRTNARPAWSINLLSRERVSKFLNLVMPYLVAKKDQAKLVLDWCSKKRRLKKDTEDHFIQEIRTLNSRGRDTMHHTSLH